MDFATILKSYVKLDTLSLAFPASIFDNTPTPHLESYLVGQIARAATIFRVSEIIVFDEDKTAQSEIRINRLIKLFEYAECPQYLRKALFYIEPDLKYAGMINPLESQHHLRTSQIECPYREGVTTKHSTDDKGKDITEVNIGLSKPVLIDGQIGLNTRVTVKVDPADLKKLNAMLGATISPRALLVPSSEPTEKLNLYWGYFVRKADGLSGVMKENIFDPSEEKFYDVIIGTSERGTNLNDISAICEPKKTSADQAPDSKRKKRKQNNTNHILVVFGGVKGLEHSLECDPNLKNCKDVSSLFHHYINTCPQQGSNTIRTEEAILITMSALNQKIKLP